MAPPERGMLGALFASGDSVEMDKANYQVFGKAKSALEDGLRDAYKGKYFLANKGWAWAGLAFMLAMMMLVGAVLVSADPYAPPGTGVAMWFGVGLFAIAIGFAPYGGRDGARGWFALIGCALAGLGGLFFLVGALGSATTTGEVFAILSPLLALPLVISAFWWMAAPTREGRGVMDRIAGFERYLSVTEENRLEVLHPPEKTPQLFERFLPYAIALGVENKWANRFASVLAAAAADPSSQSGTGAYMGWYVGSQRHGPIPAASPPRSAPPWPAASLRRPPRPARAAARAAAAFRAAAAAAAAAAAGEDGLAPPLRPARPVRAWRDGRRRGAVAGKRAGRPLHPPLPQRRRLRRALHDHGRGGDRADGRAPRLRQLRPQLLQRPRVQHRRRRPGRGAALVLHDAEAHGGPDDAPCTLTIWREGAWLHWDDHGGTCQSNCGARGSFEHGGMAWSSRRPVPPAAARRLLRGVH